MMIESKNRSIRRSLQAKLILVFLLISLAGTLSAAVLISQFNAQALDRYLVEQTQQELASALQTHYETAGSWRDVDVLLRQANPPPAPNQPNPFNFSLADANGRILGPRNAPRHNTTATRDELEQGTPIVVDGLLVGTVISLGNPALRNDVAETFLARTNLILLVSGLVATAVALLIGFFMARVLIRPLKELATASRNMMQGDLNQQVPVRTQDELGELAHAFNQMSAELAQANQVRRQLTADIAHDLRTPLTVLSGYLEAMEDGTLTPTPARLGMMHDEVNTLKRLVSDLRTLSLADAGELQLNRESITPEQLLAQVQLVYAHQAEQQQITLRVDCAPSLPMINVDRERMRQVLGNLVSNALRFTPADGEIVLVGKMDNGRCQLQVSDTGKGIDPADLPHIFHRFYRGDKNRTTDIGESGLGLAIVRSLVEAHGGTVTAVSPTQPNGGGTTFVIELRD